MVHVSIHLDSSSGQEKFITKALDEWKQDTVFVPNIIVLILLIIIILVSTWQDRVSYIKTVYIILKSG
jgi:hypothetical protein